MRGGPQPGTRWTQLMYTPGTQRGRDPPRLPCSPGGGSANAYDYANQDPVNGTDLSGASFSIGGVRGRRAFPPAPYTPLFAAVFRIAGASGNVLVRADVHTECTESARRAAKVRPASRVHHGGGIRTDISNRAVRLPVRRRPATSPGEPGRQPASVSGDRDTSGASYEPVARELRVALQTLSTAEGSGSPASSTDNCREWDSRHATPRSDERLQSSRSSPSPRPTAPSGKRRHRQAHGRTAF